MLKHRFNSFKFAFQGIAELFKSQVNARIHLCFAVLACLAGFFLNISAIEWAIIVLCIALVIAAEAFNTALEFITDLVSPDYHPLAGKVKDVAAAAVLIIAFGAAIVGLIIFVPKVLALL